ncbi:hypothetical protein ACLOJK_012470 [Asimina triloba]
MQILQHWDVASHRWQGRKMGVRRGEIGKGSRGGPDKCGREKEVALVRLGGGGQTGGGGGIGEARRNEAVREEKRLLPSGYLSMKDSKGIQQELVDELESTKMKMKIERQGTGVVGQMGFNGAKGLPSRIDEVDNGQTRGGGDIGDVGRWRTNGRRRCRWRGWEVEDRREEEVALAR